MRRNVPSAAEVRAWKITAPAPDERFEHSDQDGHQEPPAVERTPLAIRHGYTLADVDQASRSGVFRSYGWHAGDADERFSVSRLAVLEYLYAADERPPFQELVNQAWLADHRFVAGEMRERGVNRADRGGGTTASFERYWWAAGANVPSPEGRIVERLAVHQIMPLLTDKQYEAVTALAAHGDYAAAAASLGIGMGAFDGRLMKARRTFTQAWHHPETPRRRATHDRRVWSRSGIGPDGRKRLTESEVQRIRERHLAGELVRDMAAEAGVSKQTLHALLRGAKRPAPDQAGA